ncbi:odorant receptor 67d-like [Bradysia coprophila]|uniref:odorant receptor 67d-like n=1 Tax=Bradysia coprophila TaxID=38358 RepID=UPI00187D9995|nr:odorant receptor 67d-like [Bradysia coprophila]
MSNAEPPKVVLAANRVLTDKLPIPTAAYLIFSRSLQFLELFGIVIGVRISFDWKNNTRFKFTKFITAFCWSQFFYTKIVYVHQGSAMKTFEVFAVYGIAISAVLKIWCFEKYHKNIRALFVSSLKICQQNTGSRADRLNHRSNSNFTFLKFIASVAVFIAILYMFYPVKSFLIDGELVPFVPIEIMLVDQSVLWGYIVVSCIMITLGVYAILGTEYMGLAFVFLIINYSPRVDLLEIDIEELNDLWSDTSTSTLAHRHLFLRNICRKCIDIREYIAEIKNIFDDKMYIFFVFAYLSQILCMYQVRVNNWIPGYALAIGFFIEMIFYCLMGTKVTMENERTCHIIAQSKWYTYDLKSQKMMTMLLNSVMNSDELWIGPIAPLSVYTATEIVKSIYTYYTVMTEVM